MSASQAERRRFKSGHPLDTEGQFVNQFLAPIFPIGYCRPGFNQLHDLWSNATGTAFLIKSFENQLSRSGGIAFIGLYSCLIKPLTCSAQELVSIGIHGLEGYRRFQQRLHSDNASIAFILTNG